MSEERREGTVRQDVLGILLFSLAVFFAVSVILSMVQGMPSEGQGGTSALVASLVEFLGAAPCLVISIGLAFLGARQWVAGPTPRTPLEALGLTGAVLGLAVLLGTLTESGAPVENPSELAAGGLLGTAIGGFLTRTLTVFLAAPIGLALALAPIWWIWIRPTGLISELISKKPGQEPSGRAALSRNENQGVSAAEAEALLPPPASVSTVEDALLPPASPPESPYPEDVRLQGEIPAGARPIKGAHARSEAKSPAQTIPLDEGAPEGLGTEPPGEDLAEAPVALERESAAGVAEEPQAQPGRAPGSGLLSLPDEPPTVPSYTRPAPIPVEPQASVEVSTGLPAASWEQPELFEAEAPPSPPSAPIVPAAEREELAPEDDSEVIGSSAPIAELSEVEEEELETEAPEEEEEAEVEGELAEDEEYEDEDEEYEEEEDEEEEGDEEEGEYAEDSEEDEYEDEAEEEDEEGELAEDEEYEDEDEDEEYEEEEAEEPAEQEVVAEREVVLEPQAPAESQTEPKPENTNPAAEDLIYRAGCLILDRGRVAVSMLQREFSLDFKEATRILDQLQDSGLIGPYIGGQSRDILMTPEEWRQTVGVE